MHLKYRPRNGSHFVGGGGVGLWGWGCGWGLWGWGAGVVGVGGGGLIHHFGLAMPYGVKDLGPWFNIKMSSYQCRKSHCGDKTVVRSSYLHNGISYTGKMSSLYWIRALVTIGPGNHLTLVRQPEPMLAYHQLRHVVCDIGYCSCLFPIHWSQVLCREWWCSWSSADRRCCNYIWVMNKFIACWRCVLY